MKTLKSNTKAAAALRNEYRYYKAMPARDIYGAYKTTPSRRKISSFYRWNNWINDNFTVTDSVKVVTAGCQFYSIGFEYTDQDTGAVCYCKITPSNIYAVEI